MAKVNNSSKEKRDFVLVQTEIEIFKYIHSYDYILTPKI
jgi:hypothetical protein